MDSGKAKMLGFLGFCSKPFKPLWFCLCLDRVESCISEAILIIISYETLYKYHFAKYSQAMPGTTAVASPASTMIVGHPGHPGIPGGMMMMTAVAGAAHRGAAATSERKTSAAARLSASDARLPVSATSSVMPKA